MIYDFIIFLDKHEWAATLITVFATAIFAAWQLNRQFKNTIAAQRANKLEELRVQIYQEIADKIEECQCALSIVFTNTLALPSSFETKVYEDNIARQNGLSEAAYAISHRYPAITAQYVTTMKKLAEVIFVMDKYEIAFSAFASMKEHILRTHHKLNNVTSDFHLIILRFIPRDIIEDGKEKIFCPPLPGSEELDKIKELSTETLEVSMDLSAFLHDLRIEAQNVLLSSIFEGKKARARIPEDPSFPVLSLDTAQNKR